MKYPTVSTLKYRNLLYAIRFLVCVLTMEFLLHYAYVTAISKDGNWNQYSAVESAMISFIVLFMTWLKLLIPWRLFRLWSLIDDIEPPENIVRCMCNNYSAVGFWRAWHRSFNRWLIRYIYVPLGGSNHSILNLFIIFTFVALWHDISWELFAWGWLIVLFILPERLCCFMSRRTGLTKHPYYRYISGFGAALNIYFMIICNLIGFAVGIDGIKNVLVSFFLTLKGKKFIYFRICITNYFRCNVRDSSIYNVLLCCTNHVSNSRK